MVLSRLSNNDLEDLRKLLIYYKENTLDVNDLNEVIILLSEKYEFDPFTCSINILTGIISERKKNTSLYGGLKNLSKKHIDKVTVEKEARLDRKKNVVMGNLKITCDDDSDFINNSPLPIIDETTAISKNSSMLINNIYNSYLSEFDAWINTNDLTYLEVRKMISNLEYYRRMNEVKPNSVHDTTGYLQDFSRWVDSRGLTYLNLRKMLATLNEGENRKIPDTPI